MHPLWLTLLMLPLGIAIIVVGRRRRGARVIGGALCLAALGSWLAFHEFFIWQVYCVREWSIRIPVNVGNYEISLVQSAGVDFYDTTLEIVRRDGRQATILIDGDDEKWKNPRILHEAGAILIVADNKIRVTCPVIDITHKTVTVSGWTKGTLRLAELEYR